MRVFVVKKYRKTLKWMRWCPRVFGCICGNKMICLVQKKLVFWLDNSKSVLE